MNDYFAVFGLPRKLEVDLAALERRFYELSREHHPDFHQGAPPERQAAALEASALINRAYRALRDPLARVEYLIALEEGRETKEGDKAKPKAPASLLEEMLQVQETLGEARAGGIDDTSRAWLVEERRRLIDQRAAVERLLISAFPEWDRAVDSGGDRKALIKRFKEALAERAYLRTVIDDLGDALGESEADHVSHRRH